ncbi:tRNA lysidine(34) synthetase TilS [Roseomonas stagni]|uniref:tRNA(Ile)-lysidine synthase n=1 Tax=Falsiroseomonas algicola TaxID=2716930 RepID=A0A6M1LGY8_9PROT|nr:tRNA lysidine(34) synthetase TilS [Falsiroseomonas algicola]NGM19372.1 tRNA lysidine(34) synthetase TilS [Falsiroseomonas algicola]
MDGPGAIGASEFDALMAPLGPFGVAPVMVAGVSGGPHSLALALLLARWAGARGGRLVAGIVDHGLRDDSAAEASTVAGWMAARGIEARVEALGLAPGPGMQARAREGRLAALMRVCAAVGAPWLALGQHRGDQAETLLLRGFAGSGPAGLAGMAAARSAGGVLVIRPLLGVAPARLEAVVAAAGLAPIRDPSNENSAFARVRLRVALGDPVGEGPGVAALAAAAAAFARRRVRSGEAVAARIAQAARLHPEGFARLDLAALGTDGMAVAALAALLRVVSGAAFAPPRDAVAALLARGEGTLGGARLMRGGLLLREEAAMAPPVPALPGARWDGRFVLEGRPPEGCVIGALGDARLPRPPWLPAAVARTMPAIRRDTVLVAAPGLSYPSSQEHAACRLRFAPAGAACA